MECSQNKTVQHAIKILPIPDLHRCRSDLDKEKTIIIQIQNTKNNPLKVICTLNAKLSFFYIDDVNKGEEGFITELEAEAIIEIGKWLSRQLKEYKVYVCCYAGLSRSPAIALELNKILFAETLNSFYGFRVCDIQDCYQHYNRDISKEIERVYNKQKETK